jgi:hypothetical protein
MTDNKHDEWFLDESPTLDDAIDAERREPTERELADIEREVGLAEGR